MSGIHTATIGAVAQLAGVPLQIARPTSDVDAASWRNQGGDVPVYTSVNEVTADDATYAYEIGGGSTTLTLGLQALTNPGSGAVPHVITCRSLATATQATLTIRLMQATTTIASFSTAQTTTQVSRTFALTAAQAGAITNYGALRLQFQNSAGFNDTRISQTFLSVGGS